MINLNIVLFLKASMHDQFFITDTVKLTKRPILYHKPYIRSQINQIQIQRTIQGSH